MRGRRLTLAPATRRALQPRKESGGSGDDAGGDGDDVVDNDRACKEGREELARVVALVAEVSGRPKPIHGVEFVKSKFWASGDSDSDDEEISTPELITEAAAAGFSVQDLHQAERELSNTKVCSNAAYDNKQKPEPLARRIVSAIIQRKAQGRPWQGPLPPPRVSPPKTLGDALESAKRINGVSSQRKSASCRSMRTASRKSSHYYTSSSKTDSSRRGDPIPFCLSPASSGKGRRLAGSNFFKSGDDAKFQATSSESIDDEIFPALSSGARAREPISKTDGPPNPTENVGQEKVLIGPNKWFRPTPGLVSLFARTGTRCSNPKRYVLPQQPPLHHRRQSPGPRRSYVEVVRDSPGKQGMANEMAAGAPRGGANHSFPRGGGQGALVGRGQGYNPGFQLGFTPGYDGGRGGYRGRGHLQRGGRGRRRGRRGRGRGYNYGYDNYGYGYNGGAGYHEFHGDGSGFQAYNSSEGYQGFHGGGNGFHASGRGGHGGREQHHGGRGSGHHKEEIEQQKADKMEVDEPVHQPTMGADEQVAAEKVEDKVIGLKGKEVQREAESCAHGAARTGGKNKPYCYRCLTKGHVVADCTTKISCDLCVTDSHVTKVCPQAKAAKQTAMLCGYAVEGLGFYYIPYNGKLKVQPESRAATVKIIEGSMTASSIAVELERLVPGSKNWDVQEKGENTFTTTFPSRAELTRMVLWGAVQAKSVKAKMEVHEIKETEIYKYEIPKCWIQFRGLPQELREEVPIAWAVGSILGLTKMVDMKFTKLHGVARLRVALLNPDLVPDLVEVVIGDYVYELQFRVENEDMENNPVPINMELDPNNDGNGNGESNNGNNNEDHTKDQKGSKDTSGNDSNSGIPPSGSSEKFSAKNKKVVLLSPSADGSNNWTATPLPSLGVKGAAKSATEKPLHDIAKDTITPTRSSKRNASVNDQDSLERAAKLKARRNLEDPKPTGTIQGNVLAPTVGQIAAM